MRKSRSLYRSKEKSDFVPQCRLCVVKWRPLCLTQPSFSTHIRSSE